MKRYNPPSNWPTPPKGWQPGPDWQPDPSWGPAPPGHQLWIDEEEPGSGPTQHGKAIAITALILAGIALLLCWIPIVNNAVFFLGAIAVILGVIAIVQTVRGRSTYRGMAIASLVIGVLSIVGVLATQAIYSSMLSGISDAVGGETVEGVQPEQDEGAGGGAEPSPATTGTAEQPLSLGTAAPLGEDYEVAITGVILNANDQVLGANQFNEPPVGQYVLVQLSATYVGAEEGTPWIDLAPTFVGSDARQYDASDCRAVLDQGAMDVPTLENGGNASYQVCMDVPPAAIEGGKIFLEENFALGDKSRIYWAIQ